MACAMLRTLLNNTYLKHNVSQPLPFVRLRTLLNNTYLKQC